MISKKTKYGLNAVIYLAREFDKGAVLISDLAEDEKMPKKFLEAILLELKNRGMLQSKKGKGGGYTLAKSPKDITIGEIVRALEGPLAPVSCVSQTAYQKCEECKDERCCGIRFVMKEVRDAISSILDKRTLADVIEQIHNAQNNQAMNYII